MKNVNEIKVCIFGVNGLVGGKMLEVLDERYYPSREGDAGSLSRENIILVNSDISIKRGSRASHIDSWFLTSGLEPIDAINAFSLKPDIVLMSAGDSASEDWAKKFAESGSFVIDNSSQWRMDDSVPLVIPDVSGWHPSKDERLIANPNCVAIMVATAVNPFVPIGIKSLSVTALQSVSGAGIDGLKALRNEEEEKRKYYKDIFPGRIYNNIIPASNFFSNSNYNQEEEKGIEELKKIFKNQFDSSFRSFRVPIPYGHTATVSIEFNRKISLDEILNLIHYKKNIKYQNDPFFLEEAIGHDECFVSGIRKVPYSDNVIELIAMSDNLRLGAASNAVSIMDKIIKANLI